MSYLSKRKVFVGTALLMAIICAVHLLLISRDQDVISTILLIDDIENTAGPSIFSRAIASNKSHLVHSVTSIPWPGSKIHKSKKARPLMVSLSSNLPTLPPDVIQGVKTFMFFIGYPRSGHSIVGSILDAHPHVVISNELKFFEYWPVNEKATPRAWTAHLYNIIYQASITATRFGVRNAKSTYKGYTLAIDSLWQGKFDEHIYVFGDKSGSSTTQLYIEDRSTFRAGYQEFVKNIGVPIKVLHVLRNPYDVITTRILYKIGHLSNKTAPEFVVGVKNIFGNITTRTRDMGDAKIDDHTRLESSTKTYFEISRAVMGQIELIGRRNVLDIHLRDLIHNPRSTILSISSFLGIDVSDKYLQLCVEKVYKKISHSRNLVVWPLDLRMTVEHRMKEYEMLQGYNFTSD